LEDAALGFLPPDHPELGRGAPEVDGRTSVPGLYFVGVHWMRKNKSAILYGVGEDAEVVARHIVDNRS